MKKLISIIALVLCTLAVSAQKDVTKFLGIPVDGTKSAMRQKLISKGFKPYLVGGKEECLTGEFNGHNVNVHIVTNNNKVYRIMVADANTCNEGDIKIRFNNLVRQFENNKRYITLKNFSIPEEEDISYEMSVNAKVYEANYFQQPNIEKMDAVALKEKMLQEFKGKIPDETTYENADEATKKDMLASIISLGLDIIDKKSVWFRISEYYGKYYIVMYYDNEYNHANGEDL